MDSSSFSSLALWPVMSFGLPHNLLSFTFLSFDTHPSQFLFHVLQPSFPRSILPFTSYNILVQKVFWCYSFFHSLHVA